MTVAVFYYHSTIIHLSSFSFVFTIEEVPSEELAEESLYDEISLDNSVESIANLETELTLNAEG